ncbi:MAG: hypothetical protein CMB64_04355 [Euryarchaeota archaeon]|nr:hypothetical protein [Euryarchaeota archaeon]
MSKHAYNLVLLIGILLVFNSHICHFSTSYNSNLENESNIRESTSARSNPVISEFSVNNPRIGDGITPSSRAWFSVGENDLISFSWDANDDNLDFATLSNVPGDAPNPDVTPFDWEWELSSGLDEGIFNPVLTVQDLDSNVATSTIYIGIDRTGPVVGTPSISYDKNGVTTSISEGDWVSTTEINVSNLNVGVSDMGGVGVDSYEYQILPNGNGWNPIQSSGSATILVQPGDLILQFRAVDLLENRGEIVNFTFDVDTTSPNFHGWDLPEITTSTVDNVPISFTTSDIHSGINPSNTFIEYGFDSDGMGNSPDESNGWTSLSTDFNLNTLTFSTSLNGIIWDLKENQYLMLRAIISDNASNQKVTDPMFVTILPGIDLSWDLTQLDRLVIRTGSGQIFTLNSTIISNEPFSESFEATLQLAPADRDSNVEWTTISTETIPIGAMSDLSHEISWKFSLTSGGQWDVRVLLDSGEIIDERNENNNERYLIVSGADGDQVSGIVSGFNPSILSLLIVGLIVSRIINRARIE